MAKKKCQKNYPLKLIKDDPKDHPKNLSKMILKLLQKSPQKLSQKSPKKLYKKSIKKSCQKLKLNFWLVFHILSYCATVHAQGEVLLQV